ncbi:MAG: hypothetical protein CMJ88_10900, partial [Planctomycetes bacterium]|nr:hypothetical protein [Planctomycetota bacterium]
MARNDVLGTAAMAYYILCVLDGTPQNRCRVPSTPLPRKPRLVAAAYKAKCSRSLTSTFKCQ